MALIIGALSGFLIGTSYMPFPPWAIFFCYVPLWHFTLKQKRLKPLLIAGWVCQFTLTLVGFNWVAYTIKEFGFFPWPLAIVGLLGFASFANLHIPIALSIWFVLKTKFFNKNNYLAILSLPVVFDLCLRYYPMIFEWHLGYSWFYANWPAFHTAQIWGFRLINTFILFFNLLFLFIFKNFKNKKKWIGLIVSIVLFVILNLFGTFLKNKQPNPEHIARVAVIQPNIPNYSRQRAWNITQQLMHQTEEILHLNSNVDFVLWSEGVYHYIIDSQALLNKQQTIPLQKWIQTIQTPLVLSATGRLATSRAENLKHGNAIFVFNQNGELSTTPYYKTILLAFGEYMPAEKWLPINKWLSYYGRSFHKGTGSNKVTQLNQINLGFQICYEGLFDYFTRDLAKKKAQILINVTNDSWFGNWQEPWQHLYMTLAHAIEVRRPLIRGTNSGISAMISAKGDIQLSTPPNKRWSGVWEVPYSTKNRATVFTSWGYCIHPFLLWTLLLAILGLSFKKPAPNTPFKHQLKS